MSNAEFEPVGGLLEYTARGTRKPPAESEHMGDGPVLGVLHCNGVVIGSAASESIGH